MMNKTKILLLLLVVTIFSQAESYCECPVKEIYCSESFDLSDDESDHCLVEGGYRYFSVGVGPIVFIPNIGIGYRERFTRLGFDTALGFSTIGYAHQVSLHFAGHYYLNPYTRNSYYLGLGVLGSGLFSNHHGLGYTLSPDFIFGKELKSDDNTRHFIELHVASPTMWMRSRLNHTMELPLVYVKYGVSF